MSTPLLRLGEALQASLYAREQEGLLRTLEVPPGVDLLSNDYLGYACDPERARAPHCEQA